MRRYHYDHDSPAKLVTLSYILGFAFRFGVDCGFNCGGRNRIHSTSHPPSAGERDCSICPPPAAWWFLIVCLIFDVQSLAV